MLLFLLTTFLATASVQAINPSGDCVANDNGERIGFHSPDPTDEYVH